MRVATVFSGIGAIEHALERMGVEHEIVFACDNSDIDWTEKSTKKRQTRESLRSLEEKKATMPGLPGLSRVHEHEGTPCRNDTALDFEPILDESKFENKSDANALSNQRIVCHSCNAFYADRLGWIRGHLTGVQKEALRLRSISNSPHLTGVQKEAQRLLSISNHGDETQSAPSSESELEQLFSDRIHSIQDPAKRKDAIDQLYGGRGKVPFVEQSYLNNYDVPEGHFHKDVRFLSGTDYRDKVDLFVGGSPCQSFSFVGAQRGFEDARGTLFYDFVRLVDEIRPRMFIWENVKGVYSHDSGKTWDVVSRCFDETGYTWHHAILNSNNYGIPQHRQRVFVVGFRDGGSSFEFPEPVELRTTMQDFLEDSVAGKYFLGTKGVDFVTWDKNHRKQYTQIDGEVMLCQKANQQFNWHGDFVFVEENEGQHRVDEKYFLSQKVERYVLASGTKGFSAKPETDLEVARPILATLFKNHRAGVDNYVTTEGRLRMLTPKECLRLMGFCDSFEQAVSDVQMYRQAGNSIVVDVLIAIMAQAIPVLAAEDATFSSLKERAERVRELFDELPERQIQQSDLERVVAALTD